MADETEKAEKPRWRDYNGLASLLREEYWPKDSYPGQLVFIASLAGELAMAAHVFLSDGPAETDDEPVTKKCLRAAVKRYGHAMNARMAVIS